MTNEDQLCLLLARGELIPEGRPRILDLLATPLHWPRILECAYSHQIYPLLYRNLLALGFPNVPEAIQSELKGLYLANACAINCWRKNWRDCLAFSKRLGSE